MSKSIVIFFLTIATVFLSLAEASQQELNHSGAEQMPKAEPNNLTTDANNIIITIVYDNNPYNDKLGTSWGFSCVVTGMEKTILFDTGGDGQLLLKNMSKMEIDVNSIETIVLSHIHADHTGGLESFLLENKDVNVYMPESFPESLKKKVASRGASLVEVDKQIEICRNVYSTGQLGEMIKEQGLILRTEKGLILITGCAHPGILEMVQKTNEYFNEEILFVMGGFHLKSSTESEIEHIIDGFEKIDVKYTGPCHCSGKKARSLFAQRFRDNFLSLGVGRIIKIKDLN